MCKKIKQKYIKQLIRAQSERRYLNGDRTQRRVKVGKSGVGKVGKVGKDLRYVHTRRE